MFHLKIKASEKQKRDLARARKISAAGREIGPLPKPVNTARRLASRLDLEFFALTYRPKAFSKPFCPDQREAIKTLQAAAISGGLFAFAMPRGGGKTTLCETAAIWAVLHGHQRFVVPIGSTQAAAEELLGSIKSELLGNDLLAADFPEVCVPIRALEGDARRAKGQIVDGRRTAIQWTGKKLVLPDVAGSPAAGAILQVCGLTGRIRGLRFRLPDGSILRPGLIIADDPQTTESAASEKQTAMRQKLLVGDCLGLAGPGQKIACACPCTVIEPGDLADRILNRKLHPEWQGKRYRLVYALPTNTPLWETYAQIRRDSLEADGHGDEATHFYAANRQSMDEGAVVAWPDRFNADELSAVQNAMNLKIDRGAAFDAEYQNAPRRTVSANSLDPAMVIHRLSGIERFGCSSKAEVVTAFVDVGLDLLWFGVAGWSQAGDGELIDYGVFPEQRIKMFAARSAGVTLGKTYPQAGEDGAVYAGLNALIEALVAREYKRVDGAAMPLKRLTIDCGWGTDLIRTLIARSPYGGASGILTASKGVGIGPGQTAISDYRRKPGEQIGPGWILGTPGTDRLRLLRHDANYWKSKVRGMLTRPMGSPGGMVLFGRDAERHKLLAQHLASEYPTPTTAKGVTVDVWALKPGCDNHLWDVMVGASVAASFEKMNVGGVGMAIPRPKKKGRFSERQSSGGAAGGERAYY